MTLEHSEAKKTYLTITGCVELPGDVTEDIFFDKFIEFIESIKGTFGGGIGEVDENGNPIIDGELESSGNINDPELKVNEDGKYYYEEGDSNMEDSPLTHVIYEQNPDEDTMFAWTYSKESAELITEKLNG
jgi:hypothetical protein